MVKRRTAASREYEVCILAQVWASGSELAPDSTPVQEPTPVNLFVGGLMTDSSETAATIEEKLNCVTGCVPSWKVFLHWRYSASSASRPSPG